MHQEQAQRLGKKFAAIDARRRWRLSQPREFAKDKDGGVYHMNRAGRWVKLDPAYAEHKQLHAEASAAIAKVEARIANYPQ